MRGIYGSQLPEEDLYLHFSLFQRRSYHIRFPESHPNHPVNVREPKGRGDHPMKKIKTMLAMLLAAVMLLMPMQAFAAESIGSIRAYNARCTGKNFLNRAGLEIVELANARIEAIIAESQAMAANTDNPDVLNGIAVSLQIRTCAVSGAAQVAATCCGVMTACDWVDVTLGCGDNAITVSVDPLRVVLV